MRPRVLVSALMVLALLAASGVQAENTGGAASDGLKPGDTLDQSSADRAKDLLPREILSHYQKNEYVNPILDWPPDVYNWPEDFAAGSKRNEGRYTTGKLGEIIDSTTGKQVPYIIGFPFPKIDPADPAAGVKAVWNFFYRTYYFGNLRAESQVNMMNPHALERRLDVDVKFLYYDGVPEEERLPDNPQNFLYQQIVLVKGPADLQGTGSLSWRYQDPQKRDSAWAYVPALRRVRAVSPANRSDGFLGSDMSQDDGPFFDGKPEDFDWKMQSEVDELRIVDPLNLQGKSGNLWLDKGGWRANWPDTKFLGYMDSQWKGVSWAPITAGLAKRKFYVVQGIPRDKYYLFGKIELHFDKITFQGSWNRKFDWKGELLNTEQVMAWNPHTVLRPNGKKDWVQGTNQAFQCAENIKLGRATVAGIKSSPTSNFDVRLNMDPKLFDLDALSQQGK
ncbi:MAG: DUF1329 domain-containing protein [Deltaproteobacteria bacterium]|nr:MAG: DUF1329 domain-containing protein [Deltaproteobacteria bacterium]